MRGEACARWGESFAGGEGPLGEAYSLQEVCRRCHVRSEAVPKPSEAGETGEARAIQEYRRRGGSASGVPLKRGPAMYKFGLGDAEGNFSSTCLGPLSPKCSLQCSDIHPIGYGCCRQCKVFNVGQAVSSWDLNM